MNSGELERWLRKQGCKIIAKRGRGGHVRVIYQGKWAMLPRHGGRREMKPGTVAAILKQLGLGKE